MSNVFQIVAVVATVALCAIVGIYYCWVRKIGKPDQIAEPQQPGTPR